MIYHKGTQIINAYSYEANPCLHAQVFNKMMFQTKTPAPMTMENLEDITMHDYKVSLVLYQYTKY